jgi:hypothetical protein
MFQPPTVEEGPASWGDRLFLRVKLTRGVTVRFPSRDELTGATTAYMGGHQYQVDDATRAALIAAGVGVTSANFQYVTG